MSITPIPGINVIVASGGVSVAVIPPMPLGGVITNPYSAADQGLSAPEVLYVNPIDAATLNANGNTFALQPGQSWTVVPNQSTGTTVNAASTGHKFSAISW